MSAVCLHILISHSRVAEVPCILECYAVSYCKWFPTFRMTALSSFGGCLTFEEEGSTVLRNPKESFTQ